MQKIQTSKKILNRVDGEVYRARKREEVAYANFDQNHVLNQHSSPYDGSPSRRISHQLTNKVGHPASSWKNYNRSDRDRNKIENNYSSTSHVKAGIVLNTPTTFKPVTTNLNTARSVGESEKNRVLVDLSPNSAFQLKGKEGANRFSATYHSTNLFGDPNVGLHSDKTKSIQSLSRGGQSLSGRPVDGGIGSRTQVIDRKQDSSNIFEQTPLDADLGRSIGPFDLTRSGFHGGYGWYGEGYDYGPRPEEKSQVEKLLENLQDLKELVKSGKTGKESVKDRKSGKEPKPGKDGKNKKTKNSESNEEEIKPAEKPKEDWEWHPLFQVHLTEVERLKREREARELHVYQNTEPKLVPIGTLASGEWLSAEVDKRDCYEWMHHAVGLLPGPDGSNYLTEGDIHDPSKKSSPMPVLSLLHTPTDRVEMWKLKTKFRQDCSFSKDVQFIDAVNHWCENKAIPQEVLDVIYGKSNYADRRNDDASSANYTNAHGKVDPSCSPFSRARAERRAQRALLAEKKLRVEKLMNICTPATQSYLIKYLSNLLEGSILLQDCTVQLNDGDIVPLNYHAPPPTHGGKSDGGGDSSVLGFSATHFTDLGTVGAIPKGDFLEKRFRDYTFQEIEGLSEPDRFEVMLFDFIGRGLSENHFSDAIARKRRYGDNNPIIYTKEEINQMISAGQDSSDALRKTPLSAATLSKLQKSGGDGGWKANGGVPGKAGKKGKKKEVDPTLGKIPLPTAKEDGTLITEYVTLDAFSTELPGSVKKGDTISAILRKKKKPLCVNIISRLGNHYIDMAGNIRYALHGFSRLSGRPLDKYQVPMCEKKPSIMILIRGVSRAFTLFMIAKDKKIKKQFDYSQKVLVEDISPARKKIQEFVNKKILTQTSITNTLAIDKGVGKNQNQKLKTMRNTSDLFDVHNSTGRPDVSSVVPEREAELHNFRIATPWSRKPLKPVFFAGVSDYEILRELDKVNVDSKVTTAAKGVSLANGSGTANDGRKETSSSLVASNVGSNIAKNGKNNSNPWMTTKHLNMKLPLYTRQKGFTTGNRLRSGPEATFGQSSGENILFFDDNASSVANSSVLDSARTSVSLNEDDVMSIQHPFMLPPKFSAKNVEMQGVEFSRNIVERPFRISDSFNTGGITTSTLDFSMASIAGAITSMNAEHSNNSAMAYSSINRLPDSFYFEDQRVRRPLDGSLLGMADDTLAVAVDIPDVPDVAGGSTVTPDHTVDALKEVLRKNLVEDLSANGALNDMAVQGINPADQDPDAATDVESSNKPRVGSDVEVEYQVDVEARYEPETGFQAGYHLETRCAMETGLRVALRELEGLNVPLKERLHPAEQHDMKSEAVNANGVNISELNVPHENAQTVDSHDVPHEFDEVPSPGPETFEILSEIDIRSERRSLDELPEQIRLRLPADLKAIISGRPKGRY